MDVAGPWSVSTSHSFALLLTSVTQKKNRVGCFLLFFCVQVWNLVADALPALQRVCDWGTLELPWAKRHAVPLSSPPISASLWMLLLLCAVPSCLHPLRGGEKEPRAFRHQRAACHGEVSSHFKWIQAPVNKTCGSGWSTGSAALPSERWGCPSQITRLKTASWPWRRASWGCQSTPACWSMPSWSGGWGESLNLPLTQHARQHPQPGGVASDLSVHSKKLNWWCAQLESLRGEVQRGSLSRVSHLNFSMRGPD